MQFYVIPVFLEYGFYLGLCPKMIAVYGGENIKIAHSEATEQSFDYPIPTNIEIIYKYKLGVGL